MENIIIHVEIIVNVLVTKYGRIDVKKSVTRFASDKTLVISEPVWLLLKKLIERCPIDSKMTDFIEETTFGTIEAAIIPCKMEISWEISFVTTIVITTNPSPVTKASGDNPSLFNMAPSFPNIWS